MPARRTELLTVALLVAIALARITSTYTVFSQTFDEPVHIAAGLEWLDHGTAFLVPYNPPLARVFEAIGPYLDGARFAPAPDPVQLGNRILYGGDYLRRLTLARAGNLPFFLLASMLVWAWGRRLGGKWVGVLALLLFTTLPPILGHSALATTDMAVTALTAAAIYVFVLFIETPTAKFAILLGLTVALAIVSKFSALLFLPAGFAAVMVLALARRVSIDWKGIARSAVVAVVIMIVVVWGTYRFSTIPASRVNELVLPNSPLLPLLHVMTKPGVPLPAPELIAGIGMLVAANRYNPYPFYFFGDVNPHGHALYFPVMLAVKTPLTVLALFLAAFAFVRGKPWQSLVPLVTAVATFLCGFAMHTQGGLRYLFVVYPMASVAAAIATVELFRRWRTVATLMVAAQVIIGVAAHPDYLAYFNVLAGNHPERIAIDSDLDWGQDLLRVRDAAQRFGINDLSIAYFGSADVLRHDLAPHVSVLRPGEQRLGWIAISETYRHPIWTDGYSWINRYPPVAKIGKSIWLYKIR